MKPTPVNEDEISRQENEPYPIIKDDEVLVEIHVLLTIIVAEAAHDILYQGKTWKKMY